MEYIVSVGRPEEMESLGAERLIRCKDCMFNPCNGAVMVEQLPSQLPCKKIPREDNYYCADAEPKR